MTTGEPAPLLGAAERAAGAAQYASDIQLPRTLQAAVVRSPHPHARIEEIDLSGARAAPGVVDVITSADLPDRTYLHLGGPFSDRRVLARDKVRFIGEEVAVVVAETLREARAGAELVRVRYRLLPPVLTPAEALEDGAAKVHEQAEGNVAARTERVYGDPALARESGVARVSGRYTYRRVGHASMETHSVVASWDADQERLDIWVSSQAPYFVRKEVAHVLGLELHQVHTHDVAVGGSFGVKAKVCEHEALAAAASIRNGRPVRLVLTRDEEFAATKSRHPYEIDIETTASADGRIVHRDVEMVVDNGAYNHNGPSVPGYSAILAGSMYAVEGVRAASTLAYTNTIPGGSFRGYGNPQITFAMESQVDELADALGMDPIQLRINSAHRSGDTTLTGWKLETAGLVECLEAVRDAIGWEEARERSGNGRGIGVAAAVHVSGANAYDDAEESSAAVDLHEDGRVHVRFAGSDAGTGQRTVLAQMAAEVLSVPLDHVDVSMMASEGTPRDLGAWSSRGTFMGGHAVRAASIAAAARLAALAAEKTGTDPDAAELRDGKVHAGDDDIPIGDLVRLAEDADDGVLRCEGTYRTSAVKMDRATGTGSFSEAYCFSAQAVEVDVDDRTGEVHVLRVVSAHDSGRIINPLAAEGQVVGAVAMGLGAALGEDMNIVSGKVANPRYVDYALPRAADMPPVEVIFVGDPDPKGPFGAKGLGEIGLVPTVAAVGNAIADATGARVRTNPFTPDRVLAAIAESRGEVRPQPSVSRPIPVWRRPSRWWIAFVRAAYPRGLHALLHRWGTRWARPLAPGFDGGVISANSVEDAVTAMAQPDTVALGGGTDVVVRARAGHRAAAQMVDLMAIPTLAGIERLPSGAVRIGATTTLAELADATAGGDLDVLARAVGTIAGPQVRAAATVAGNLCQENRCVYFRNGFACYKRGGPTCPCYAIEGDHRLHHAVIGGHRCQAVTPSDLATVFAALDASVHTASVRGARRLSIGELYCGPGETVLNRDEVVTEVQVPPTQGRRHAFEKLALSSGGFAMASAAVSARIEDGRLRDPRVVLGGVAPVPHRAVDVEERIEGLDLNDADIAERIDAASQAWCDRAHPLRDNAWKLGATSALVSRAIRGLA